MFHSDCYALLELAIESPRSIVRAKGGTANLLSLWFFSSSSALGLETHPPPTIILLRLSWSSCLAAFYTRARSVFLFHL